MLFMRGLFVGCVAALGIFVGNPLEESNARAQYEVEEESPVWVRGLLDVRVARGGRSSSWTSGGPAKTRYGGRETSRTTRLTVPQLALELGASLPWDIVARAQLNWDPDGYNDDRPLLIEAYLRKEWGEWESGWGVQTGVMNLPFSLEHVGPAWTPKYTLTPSALNSWLWEEGHVVGIEGEWWRVTQSRLRLGLLVGSGFGQDQSGHLLAVRGWVLSDALHGVNSDLPLPVRGEHVPAFDEQDHRPSLYVWFTLRDLQRQAELGIGYFDNFGDQDEDGVWETRFGVLGLTLHPLAQMDVVTQYLMGTARHEPCNCDVDFQAFYALASWHHRSHRLSARYDVFRTNDQDGPPNYRDRGDAVTLAYLFEFGLYHRIGVEYVFVQSRHAQPFRSSPSDDGWQLSYRFRY